MTNLHPAHDNTSVLKALGEVICQRRRHKNMSQEIFASKCNLNRAYISDLERGKRNISLTTLDIVARQLGYNDFELLRLARRRQRINRTTQAP